MLTFASTLAMQFLVPFILALLPPAGLFVLDQVKKTRLNRNITDALERAAGQAYLHVLQAGVPITAPGVLGAAVAAGADYLRERVPGALAARGISPVDVADMVQAKLGVLLAADPSVSVMEPAAPARSAPGSGLMAGMGYVPG